MPSSTQNLPPQLNLPVAELSLRSGDKGVEVYDELRQKWLLVTPEEWVRQHFVAHMVGALGFPETLLANEVAITLNGTSRRCDTVVYSRQGLKPLAIVEYKAPHVVITQRVFDQISRYNMVLRVPWLFVSNGLGHYCCRVDYDAGRCVFLKELPCYGEMEGSSNF